MNRPAISDRPTFPSAFKQQGLCIPSVPFAPLRLFPIVHPEGRRANKKFNLPPSLVLVGQSALQSQFIRWMPFGIRNFKKIATLVTATGRSAVL
jgi:hypothetical protein